MTPPAAVGIAAWPIVVLLVIVVTAVVVGLVVARGVARPRGRQPRKRHLVVRIICGALATLILGAVGVGTWQTVRGCYPAADPAASPPPPTLATPTMPVAPPEIPAGKRRVELESVRLLHQLVLVDLTHGAPRVVHVGERELLWPRDRRAIELLSAETATYEVSDSLSVSEVYARRTGETVVIEAWGESRLRYRSGHRSGSSSSSGQITLGEARLRERLRTQRAPSKDPLSIAAGPIVSERICVFTAVTLVAEDDPLRRIAASDWLAAHDAELRDAAELFFERDSAGIAKARTALPGLSLAIHVGLSSLLLLVAAGLLTQLFARRTLAFVAVLTFVVLYAAVLDRAALRSHLTRLADAEAPMATRMTAARQASDTFFYRASARERLEAIAGADAQPEALRREARLSLRWLADQSHRARAAGPQEP